MGDGVGDARDATTGSVRRSAKETCSDLQIFHENVLPLVARYATIEVSASRNEGSTTMARSKKSYPQGMTLQMVSTYLVRETVSSELNSVSTPEDAAKVVRDLFDFDHLDREQFVALALNTKNRVIGAWAVSVGSLNASIVHPRELFKPAVMLSAASIVIAHNHPSGDPTPSGADIQLTRRIVKGGDVLGIELLDHVVVGDESIASLRDLGLM
ncbi:MAG: DNA repair protein RadC [Actinobacteria bacterium]|nr:DNA repair protein RadC [Actinomycetota bacterium]